MSHLQRSLVVFVATVIATISILSTRSEATWNEATEIRRQLFSLLRGSSKHSMKDDSFPTTAEHPLLPPLWSIDDLEFDLQETSTRKSRALKQLDGNELPLVPADPDPDPQPNPARRALRNDDFVFVAPSTSPRLPLVQASRYWRKGMRAVFVMDQPPDRLAPEVVSGATRYPKSFAWFPNFRRMANDQRDHYLEGDRRAAMAPVLAYAALAAPDIMKPWTQAPAVTQQDQGQQQGSAGTSTAPDGKDDPFQWMLAGDDDTIFFMRGVKALLRDYDPQLPYFITDSMYIGSKSPQPGVWELRCYPCQGQWGKWRRAARRLLEGSKKTGSAGAAIQTTKASGCGCSTKELCKRRFPGNETRCEMEWEGPVPFGGVGFIFSIGFFKHLAASQGGAGLRAYEACINAPNTSVMSFPEGGDAFMSRCFWRLGFPITDPGYTPLGRYFGEVLQLQRLYEAPNNLTKGQLPPEALKRWSTAVSMHLGARQQKSFRAAAMTIKYITGVYDLIAEMLWPTGRKAKL